MTLAITANWEAAARDIGDVQVNVRGSLGSLIYELVLIGQRAAQQAAPKDLNNLTRSIVGEAHDISGSVSVPAAGFAATIGQAATQEFGRTPGRRMPPPMALYGWASRHGFDMRGINPGNSLHMGVLFVLARSIGRKGYPGKLYMAEAKNAVVLALPGLISQRGGLMGKSFTVTGRGG